MCHSAMHFLRAWSVAEIDCPSAYGVYSANEK